MEIFSGNLGRSEVVWLTPNGGREEGTGLYRAQTELEECLLYFGLSKNVKNEINKEYPA